MFHHVMVGSDPVGGFFGLIATLIATGGSVVAILLVGGIVLIGLKIAKGGKPSGGVYSEEDTRLIQEMHQGLARMERRLDALETIVFEADASSRAGTRPGGVGGPYGPDDGPDEGEGNR